MAVRKSTRAPGRKPAAPAAPALDDIGERIREYVDSMEFRAEFTAEIKAQVTRGRRAMERLAMSAPGEDLPTLKLSPTECADVLTWMSCCEPADPATWWIEGLEDGSRVCGYMFVLQAMADSLRAHWPHSDDTRPGSE